MRINYIYEITKRYERYEKSLIRWPNAISYIRIDFVLSYGLRN